MTVNHVNHVLLFMTIKAASDAAHMLPLRSQDAPAGYTLVVVCHKNDGKPGFCLKCYYIKRGSFPSLKTQEFALLLARNPNLKDKSFGCKMRWADIVNFGLST